MKLRYKVLSVISALVAVGIFSLALALSHDSPCAPAPALPENAQLMKAIVSRCYGPPHVLKLENIEKPSPADDEVLVKVHAAAVNPLDYHYMRGKPYVMRLMGSGLGAPEDERAGVDFAGTVEAVGKDVKLFKPGDEVFGARGVAFAEYVTVREVRNVVLKPANVTFEQAAAVPVAAGTQAQSVDRPFDQSGQGKDAVTVREPGIHDDVRGAEQGGPDPPERSHAVWKGHAGHR